MNQMFEIQKDYAYGILQEAKNFYHKINSIYDSINYSRSYQVGHMWKGGSDNMRYLLGIIESDTNAVDSIRLVQNSHMYSINPPGPIKEIMVDWYIDYLRQSGNDIFDMDSAIQESPVTNPDVCVSREGRLLTPDFLAKVVHYLEIQKYCKISKSKKLHIVELGAGCGYLARTLKLFIPNSVYVDIDIPETLYFAYIFLKLNFPNAKTCYVTDSSQLKDGFEQYDFVFIPTRFAECILPHEFDLFCNTASLGEMTNPVIRYWMDFVQNKLKVKYFFGLNRFLNTIPLLVNLELKRLEENEGSVLFDAKWKILCWELDPPFARCPYEEPCRLTKNLEIIAERLPDTSIDESDNQLRSQQIIEDLMDEDWIRCPDRYMHAIIRHPVLANNLTMSGTLFKLWESIRLHPNKTNVAMMLMYLSTLTKRGYPFEEWFYYKNLLRSFVIGDTTSRHATALAEEKYKDLWKDALALSVSYNPFNIRLLYHYIMGFLPYPIRIPIIRLIGEVYYRLRPMPYLRKIKQRFERR